jgi:hypothetical protein
MNYRRSEKKDKKLADNERLLCWWKKFHREERDAVLAGPHGATLAELFRMFKNLQHVQPAQLIGLARSIDWAVIDTNTKLVTLHEFNAVVTKLREKRNPEEPIDDTVSDEPPFRTLKAILFPERAPAGAKPGLSIRNSAA